MKRLLLAGIAAAGLLLSTVSAVAQDRDRDEGWRARMFDHVRDDVSRVQDATPYFSSDQFRLARVKEELNELQRKYDRHGYDREAMQDVIRSVERVVSDNHLSGRDRDMLNEDLDHLRRFRDHHEGYGEGDRDR